MANASGLQGPRLSFVVRELPGTVLRTKYKAPPTKAERDKTPSLEGEIQNQKVVALEPAGYIVYLPTGSCYRLSAKQLVKRGYDKEPEIIGIEQANDLKTAAGRFKLARNDIGRQKAWADMENDIIKLCQGRSGSVNAMIEDYDPKRAMPMKEAA